MNTRSGMQPSEESVVYKISTERAKSYLQNKFNLITKTARSKGVNMPDIQISMFNQKLGGNFLPFMLILPMDVLEKNRQMDENVSSIFLPAEEDRGIRFQTPFFDLLQTYSFSNKDREAFKSPNWKRMAKIEGRVLGSLFRYSKPKIEDFGQGGKRVVMFIDPLRIFHDMLVDEKVRNQKFRVFISGWKKIDDGSYEFTIDRKIVRDSGENRNSLYSQMLRKVNS